MSICPHGNGLRFFDKIYDETRTKKNRTEQNRNIILKFKKIRIDLIKILDLMNCTQSFSISKNERFTTSWRCFADHSKKKRKREEEIRIRYGANLPPILVASLATIVDTEFLYEEATNRFNEEQLVFASQFIPAIPAGTLGHRDITLGHFQISSGVPSTNLIVWLIA
jgi:hypothetical protein